LESRPSSHEKTGAFLALKKKVVKSGTRSPEEEFMFGIGMPELIIIMVIILIIFGAGKLPDIGAGMGKAKKISRAQLRKSNTNTPRK